MHARIDQLRKQAKAEKDAKQQGEAVAAPTPLSLWRRARAAGVSPMSTRASTRRAEKGSYETTGLVPTISGSPTSVLQRGPTTRNLLAMQKRGSGLRK